LDFGPGAEPCPGAKLDLSFSTGQAERSFSGRLGYQITNFDKILGEMRIAGFGRATKHTLSQVNFEFLFEKLV
jgi:hypothetical protein